jgi:hypothetical protein
MDGINAGRKTIPRARFDKKRTSQGCEAQKAPTGLPESPTADCPITGPSGPLDRGRPTPLAIGAPAFVFLVFAVAGLITGWVRRRRSS